MATSADEILKLHSQIPRVLTVVNEATSASWMWRVLWPSQALTAHGFIADWILDTQFDQIASMLQSGRYNIVVMHRLNFSDEQSRSKFAKFVHDCDAVWVYGADDYVWGDEILDPLRLPEEVAKRGSVSIEKDRRDRIREVNLCDAVLVSTAHLGELAREVTDRPVVCVPSLINSEWFTSKTQYRSVNSQTTIGWAGTFRPDSDVEILARVWKEISIKYPDVL